MNIKTCRNCDITFSRPDDCPIPDDRCEDCHWEIEAMKTPLCADVAFRNKYHREIKPGVWVDCYDVIKAWGVANPALQHLLKKALQPGGRGHKDLMTDLDDIIASAKRAKELES